MNKRLFLFYLFAGLFALLSPSMCEFDGVASVKNLILNPYVNAVIMLLLLILLSAICYNGYTWLFILICVGLGCFGGAIVFNLINRNLIETSFSLYISECQFFICILASFLIGYRQKWKNISWRILFVLFFFLSLYVLCWSLKDYMLSKWMIFAGVYLLLVIIRLIFKHICLVCNESYPHKNVVVQLGRQRMYRAKLKQIRRIAHKGYISQTKCAPALAVYGSWGSGKSHFISYLKENLSKRNKCCVDDEYNGTFRICEVNLWECKDEQIALINIVRALYFSIFSTNTILSIFPNKNEKIILKFLGLFVPGIKKLNTILQFIDAPDIWLSDDCLDKLSREMLHHRVVLVLDDIERANIDVIKSLFLIIKRLKRIKNLTVVAAVAIDELEKKNIFSTVEELHGYLNKLFELVYYLPPMSNSAIKQKIMSDINSDENNGKYLILKEFLDNVTCFYDNPRQLERVVERWKDIEQSYFSTSEKLENSKTYIDYLSDDFLKKVYMVFIVEVLKMYAPSILEKLATESLSKSFKEHFVPNIKYYEAFESKCFDFYCKNKKLELPLIVKSCLTYIYANSREYNKLFKYAYNMDYAKRIELNEVEADLIIKRSDVTSNLTFKGAIGDFFKNEPFDEDFLDDAELTLMKYCVSCLGRDALYCRFFVSAVKPIEELPISPEKRNVHSNDRYLELLYSFSKSFASANSVEIDRKDITCAFSFYVNKLSFVYLNLGVLHAIYEFAGAENFMIKEEIEFDYLKYAMRLHNGKYEDFFELMVRRYAVLIFSVVNELDRYSRKPFYFSNFRVMRYFNTEKYLGVFSETLMQGFSKLNQNERKIFVKNILSFLTCKYDGVHPTNEAVCCISESQAKIYSQFFNYPDVKITLDKETLNHMSCICEELCTLSATKYTTDIMVGCDDVITLLKGMLFASSVHA